MLNEKQMEAVNNIHGQQLIVACPGSGKTTVLVERAKKMLDSGIPADKILTITFTKEAALQMKKRFENKYGVTGIFFGTIHSICYRVIMKAYGIQQDNLLKESEQWDFFRIFFQKRVQTDDLNGYIKGFLADLSLLRNSNTTMAGFLPKNVEKSVLKDAVREYDSHKEQLKKIDFDDMLILCKQVFEEMPEELAYWKDKFSYIMIDEFQDTNSVQADIFYMLAGMDGNICVVGDDDQSIYRFRAADAKIMFGFQEKYPNAKTVFLSTNYRSQPQIVACAGRLIQNNRFRFKKEFKAEKSGKGSVAEHPLKTSEEQELAVMKRLSDLKAVGCSYNEMAVLYRTNKENQLLIGKLLELEVPFYTTESPQDYHNDFIFMDIMTYWRMAVGKEKKGDLQRILNRPTRYLKTEAFRNCPLDKRRLYTICRNLPNAYNAQGKIDDMFIDLENLEKIVEPEKFVSYMFNVMGYKETIESYAKFCMRDITEIRNMRDIIVSEAKKFETMKEWLDYADYYAAELERIRKDKRKEGICLSTFHSSKGLEWDNVLIINAANGNCPSKKAETDEDYEEERRLFYVALTRARNACDLYYIDSGAGNGASQYISEMGLKAPRKDTRMIKPIIR